MTDTKSTVLRVMHTWEVGGFLPTNCTFDDQFEEVRYERIDHAIKRIQFDPPKIDLLVDEEFTVTLRPSDTDWATWESSIDQLDDIRYEIGERYPGAESPLDDMVAPYLVEMVLPADAVFAQPYLECHLLPDIAQLVACFL